MMFDETGTRVVKTACVECHGNIKKMPEIIESVELRLKNCALNECQYRRRWEGLTDVQQQKIVIQILKEQKDMGFSSYDK